MTTTIITSRTTKERYARFLNHERRHKDDLLSAMYALRRPRPWKRWWWSTVKLGFRRRKWWHVPHWEHHKGRAWYSERVEDVRRDLGMQP